MQANTYQHRLFSEDKFAIFFLYRIQIISGFVFFWISVTIYDEHTYILRGKMCGGSTREVPLLCLHCLVCLRLAGTFLSPASLSFSHEPFLERKQQICFHTKNLTGSIMPFLGWNSPVASVQTSHRGPYLGLPLSPPLTLSLSHRASAMLLCSLFPDALNSLPL